MNSPRKYARFPIPASRVPRFVRQVYILRLLAGRTEPYIKLDCRVSGGGGRRVQEMHPEMPGIAKVQVTGISGE